jgi:hypothetical protein
VLLLRVQWHLLLDRDSHSDRSEPADWCGCIHWHQRTCDECDAVIHCIASITCLLLSVQAAALIRWLTPDGATQGQLHLQRIKGAELACNACWLSRSAPCMCCPSCLLLYLCRCTSRVTTTGCSQLIGAPACTGTNMHVMHCPRSGHCKDHMLMGASARSRTDGLADC